MKIPSLEFKQFKEIKVLVFPKLFSNNLLFSVQQYISAKIENASFSKKLKSFSIFFIVCINTVIEDFSSRLN